MLAYLVSTQGAQSSHVLSRRVILPAHHTRTDLELSKPSLGISMEVSLYGHNGLNHLLLVIELNRKAPFYPFYVL